MEKIKILLVDDDLKFGNIAVKILQKAGYDVFFQNSLFGEKRHLALLREG